MLEKEKFIDVFCDFLKQHKDEDEIVLASLFYFAGMTFTNGVTSTIVEKFIESVEEGEQNETN